MKRSFSFTEKPVLFIIRQLPVILPGIEKVLTIFYDPEINSISAYSLSPQNSESLIEKINVIDTESHLQKLRMDKAPYSWIQKSDLPFEITLYQKVQLSIFNELDNNILLIRVKNDADDLSDLFFIYLNQNLSHFGIMNSNRQLSTENKSIIGNLVRNAINTLLINIKEDSRLLNTLKENNDRVISQTVSIRKELENFREKYKNGIIHLCRMYLNDLEKEYSNTYTFTADATTKLKEFEGDISFLKPIIKNAVLMAESLQLTSDGKPVELYDFHLDFDFRLHPDKSIKSQAPLQDIPSGVSVRYNKTLILLNKLESAALSVKENNKVLTSSNVAGAFPSPVTPSAISDALKKHRPKILHLFQEFPERWEVIRTEFRPVQNILNTKEEKRKETGS